MRVTVNVLSRVPQHRARVSVSLTYLLVGPPEELSLGDRVRPM